MRITCGTFALTLAFDLSAPAYAQVPDAGAPSYRAPAQCPSVDDFLRRLRVRLAASRSAPASGRRLEVQIDALDGRYEGRLSLLAPDGRSTTKTLSAAECGDLVDALSLVATLALETDAVATGDRETAASPTTRPGAPSAAPSARASNGPNDPLSLAASVAPTATAAPRGAPPATAASPAPRASRAELAPTPASGSRVGVAVGGLATAGPAPRPLFGASLAASWMGPGAGCFRPALELGGAASESPDAREAGGTAGFTWLTARAVAHLLQWPPEAHGFVVRAGLAGDLGVLLARGSNTTSPATSSRPWASLGAVVGLDLPLAGWLVLRPGVGVEAPLRRDRYAFGAADFFVVPPVIATGAVTIVAYAR
jgi:hypothetical protein